MHLGIRDLVEQKIKLSVGGGYKEGTLPAALFSPFKLNLPHEIAEQVRLLANLLYSLKADSNYRDRHYQNYGLSMVSPQALEMDSFSSCLDLHVTNLPPVIQQSSSRISSAEIYSREIFSHPIKLIEYNTNAALMGLSYFLYEALALPQPFRGDIQDLRQDLLKLAGVDKAIRVAILDTQPEKQNLFGDFLFYQKLFESWGWQCEIFDTAEFSQTHCKESLVAGKDLLFDLIINRDTDFFLKLPQHSHLFEIWKKGKARLTPHPGDYVLFAEKSRMLEWQKLPAVEPFLLRTDILNRDRQEEIWAKRKNLFFKPSSSYGSKQVYKGSSISKKLFQHLLATADQMLAQEYCEPLKFEVIDPTQTKGEVKVDLRFYLFRDQVRSALARVYQGQVTNLQSPLAGFIPIVWNREGFISIEPLCFR